MAWTPQSDYASVNAKLASDPRYKAALMAYQQALAANKTTISGERQDDTGAAEAAQGAKTQAALEFAKVAHEILREQGVTDFDRLGFSPDSGVVAYEPPDHSLRNILIPMAAIATAGIASGLLGGAGAAADLGAIEGGAFGLPTSAVSALGTGAMAAVPVAGAAVPTATLAGLGGGGGAAADVGAGAAAPVGTGASAVTAAAAPTAGYTTNAAGTVMDAASVPAEAAGIGATIGRIASSNWFPTALGVAGNLAGAAIQANSNAEGAAAQERSAKEALDFVKSQAAKEDRNFAPYLAAGTGALSKLSYGLGIGNEADYNSNGMPATPPGGSPGSITPAGDPQVSPNSPAAQFIASSRTQPVWMTAPTGERQQVPANQVQHYLEKGARLEPWQGLDGGSVPRPNSLAMLGRTPGSDTIGTAAARV